MSEEVVRLPSPEEINKSKTKNGGWAKSTLASWGVSWPPPKGWKKQLTRAYLSEKKAEKVQHEKAMD